MKPDIQCDFTDLPFEDESFSLVVFDPPHLRYAGKTGWLAKKYGRLDEHWPEMLHDGFKECMRVLKEDGVLIFKWAETDIPAQKVWKAMRLMMNALEEKTKEKTVKREKNYYLVKSDVLGYAKRKGLINGRSKRQIFERGT